MDWFTADHHFNHHNIIDFCGRPFRNVDHMNRVMIERWNDRVRRDDNVFVIGDFRFGTGVTFREFNLALNGNKVFIQGNHDRNNGVNTKIKDCVIQICGMDILLTHKPEDAYRQIEAFDMAFVGHVHKEWKFRKYIVNVGVDVWDYYPVGIKTILKAYKKEIMNGTLG